MIHSFNQVDCANGNTIVEFHDDSKKRQIILTKGTSAQKAYLDVLSRYGTGDVNIQCAITMLKKTHVFKANPNNVSIFRPIVKTA